MSVVVNIRSAHGASGVCSVQLLARSSVSDLKGAICKGPLNLFTDPSNVVFVLNGSILQDGTLIESLNLVGNSCISAIRVCTSSISCAAPANTPARTAIMRGARICIHSLKQKTELNGCTGVVFCASDDQERWLVNIDSDTLVTEQAWLRPINLNVLPSNQATDPADPNWFDSLGIPFQCILEFIQRHGGESAFEGLTTSQVKRRFIMPETFDTKLSLCEQLRSGGDLRIKDAQLFVSHAWQYKFLDVVHSLQAFLAAEPNGSNATLWFDAFSTSQHETYSRPPLWWQRTFVNAIGRMGRLVMVLTPWTNPITLRRSWCILELFACINSRSTFQVAMPPDQYESTFDSNLNDEFVTMLSKVQCESSECSRDEDRVRIFETVRAAVGFTAMDRLVFETLKDWLMKKLTAEKTLCHESGDVARRLKVSRNIVNLLNTLGRPFDAEKELHEVLQVMHAPEMKADVKNWAHIQNLADSLPSKNRSDFLLLISDFGLTCLKQGRHDEATVIYEELFKSTGDHIFLLNLAMAHRASKRFVQAERLYSQCLEMRRELLGLEHRQTIVCMNSLAVTYRELKKFDLAAPLFLQVIDISKRTLGENHTDTEAAVIGLANCYRDQHRFSEAEAMYKTVLKNAQRTKGFSHPETLDVLVNIASINGDLGAFENDIKRYNAAEQMYTEAIQKGISTIGPNHPLVLRWQSNFAIDMQAKKVLFG
jgi:tetratricopeptide (TPR) repeat protein